MREFGINDDEWIIRPIGYSEKNTHFLVGDDIPSELFLKDISFEYQKEVRVVIYTRRHAVIKKLNKCNGIVNLGEMKDIADIQEYYFDDMTMQLRGRNSLIYTLPKPIFTPLEEMSPESLMAIVQQAYENRIPGKELDDECKRKEYMKPIIDVLNRRFNIDFIYSDATFIKRGTKEEIKIILKHN